MNASVDPRRHDKVNRFKPAESAQGAGDDLMPDYMNILGKPFVELVIQPIYYPI